MLKRKRIHSCYFKFFHKIIITHLNALIKSVSSSSLKTYCSNRYLDCLNNYQSHLVLSWHHAEEVKKLLLACWWNQSGYVFLWTIFHHSIARLLRRNASFQDKSICCPSESFKYFKILFLLKELYVTNHYYAS